MGLGLGGKCIFIFGCLYYVFPENHNTLCSALVNVLRSLTKNGQLLLSELLLLLNWTYLKVEPFYFSLSLICFHFLFPLMNPSSINHSCFSAPSQWSVFLYFLSPFIKPIHSLHVFLFMCSASSYLSSLHPCLLRPNPFSLIFQSLLFTLYLTSLYMTWDCLLILQTFFFFF